MAGFPWSELGLDGPADERTIRRAYASRLKIVRPDVDAAGFQRLVEARDLALRAIEQTALLPSAGLTPRASLVPKREEPVTQGHTPLPDTPEARTRAPLYSIEPETSTSTTEADEPKGIQPAETSVPIEIELSAGSRSAPAAPQRRPSQQARPVAIDIDPPKPPPTVTEPDAKPPLAEPWTGNQVSEAARAEAVVRLLSAFIDAWSRNLDLPPVAPILKLLGEQSIVARQKFEIEALRAVATLLDKGLFDKGTPRRREAARSLIAGLDDDYAWTNNDRRLYMMMPQTTADKIGRLLRVVREWEKTGVAPNFAPSSHAPPRQRPTLAKRKQFAGAAVLVLAAVKGISAIATGSWSTKTPDPTLARFAAIPGLSQTYTPALQPSPDYAGSYFNRGVAYDNTSQFDRAIQEYDQAIRLNPNYAVAYYNRGLDYANKGQFERAMEDYDQAIRLNPANPDIFVSRGVAYDGKGQYDRAIQNYDRAISLKPDYALALVDRGIAYANREQYDRAIGDYDQAIRLSPNDADALYNRGQAKRAKGDIAGGDADIAKARQFNPDLPPVSP